MQLAFAVRLHGSASYTPLRMGGEKSTREGGAEPSERAGSPGLDAADEHEEDAVHVELEWRLWFTASKIAQGLYVCHLQVSHNQNKFTKSCFYELCCRTGCGGSRTGGA